jgi:hypothetical protein
MIIRICKLSNESVVRFLLCSCIPDGNYGIEGEEREAGSET